MTPASRPTRAGKRVLSAVAAGAIAVPISFSLAGTAFATGTYPGNENAVAPAPISTTTACPPGQVPTNGYSDVPSSDIDPYCIAAYGVAKGTTATTYSPGRDVLRDEMAAFVARLVQAAGLTLNTASYGFTDIGNLSPEFQNDINGLANAGIINGTSTSPKMFSPGAIVSRAQMAKFITNALVKTGAASANAAGTNDYFYDDDGNALESYINDAAALTIVQGTSDTAAGDAYAPGNPVTRDNMAKFLARSIALEVQQGKIKNLYANQNATSVKASSSTVAPGGTETLTLTGPNITAYKVTGPCTSGVQQSGLTPNSNGSNSTYTISVPISSTSSGSCTLTTTVTYNNGQTGTFSTPITVSGAATATNLPQLTSASILKTVTASQANAANPAGTTIQYVFSKSVTGDVINPAGFHAYTANDTKSNGATGNAAQDASNPNAVDVLFPAFNTTAGAANLTLATVGGPQDTGGPAVTAPGNQSTPDGSAPIGTASSTAASAAGYTVAPNPESWNISQTGGASPTFPNSTPINVVFDQAATTTTAAAANGVQTGYPAGSSGFNAVLTNGTEVACEGPAPTDTTASGGTVPGGNGTTTLTIVCPDTTTPNTGTTLTAANIGRVIVQPGAVTGATSGPNNSLQAADTPHNTTASPDLTGVSFIPGSGTTADQIVYTFNQPVVAGTIVPADFGFYTASAQQYYCSANTVAPVMPTGTPPAGTYPCTVQQNPNNFDQVVVTVGTGTGTPPTGSGATANATGGNIKAGAVTGANSGNASKDDELGAANPNNAGSAITPGTVNAPQLTGVAVTSTTNVLGTTYSATYTFSQPVATSTGSSAGTTAGSLHLYDADGTELTCTAASVGSAAGSNQVTCTSFVQTGSATSATTAQLTNAALGTADYSAVQGGNTTSTGAANPGAGNPNPEGAANATH